MFYYYFKLFNFICAVFGMRKPYISSRTSEKLKHFDKLWSIIIAVTPVVCFYSFLKEKIEINIKTHLEKMCGVNDLFINIFLVIVHIANGETTCIYLYEMTNKVIHDFKISNVNLKLISIKMFAWWAGPTILFVICIVLEIIYNEVPFYIFLFRIPSYLTVSHLSMHLYLLLAIMKVLNRKLTGNIHADKLDFMNGLKENKKTIFKYILNPDIKFMVEDSKYNFDLTFLCKVYDDMCTCIVLLEKYHGLQIVFVIWMMFSNGVVSLTLMITDSAEIPWLVILRGGFPLFFCFIGSCVDDHLANEVERTELLIIKHLIDFRCDQPRRQILLTFKQQVNTKRLDFTALHLFRFSYGMVLGILMNVVTYGIILIELFIDEDPVPI